MGKFTAFASFTAFTPVAVLLATLAASGCNNSGGASPCPTPTQCMLPGQSTDGPMPPPPDAGVDASPDAELPLAIASNQARPHSIAVSNGLVYWSNYSGSGAIMKRCSDCATPAAPLASDQPFPLWIALSPARDTLFFTTDGASATNIMSCTLPGCTGGPTTLTTPQSGDFGLSASGNRIYWITQEAVLGCDPTSCTTTTVQLALNATYIEEDTGITRGAGNLVATSQGVFWARYAPPDMDGAIKKCVLPSCNVMVPTTFAPSQDTPWGIVADGDSLFWTNRVTPHGAVSTCTLSTGCAQITTLASSEQTPIELAVDADNVYWTDGSSGTVSKCARTGCAQMPTVLATRQALPFGIAVDSTYVYWTNLGTSSGTDGAVMRLRK